MVHVQWELMFWACMLVIKKQIHIYPCSVPSAKSSQWYAHNAMLDAVATYHLGDHHLYHSILNGSILSCIVPIGSRLQKYQTFKQIWPGKSNTRFSWPCDFIAPTPGFRFSFWPQSSPLRQEFVVALLEDEDPKWQAKVRPSHPPLKNGWTGQPFEVLGKRCG